MSGVHVIFIKFVPLVGLWLLGYLSVHNTILLGDRKPKGKKEAGTRRLNASQYGIMVVKFDKGRAS
jgi:hypothetical protein